jgi:hypothetical protein
MSLFVNRGEQVSQPFKAGTYNVINFKFQKGTAVGSTQDIDLTKCNFGLKLYMGGGQTCEVVRYTNLYALTLESSAKYSTSIPLASGVITLPDTMALGDWAVLTIDLEGYIQCVGNDYLDANLQIQDGASTTTFSVSATLPKACGVMDSIPTIDVVQVQNGVTMREEFLGDDITRITLCSSGSENLEQVVLNSDKFSPILEQSDIAVQTDEYSNSVSSSIEADYNAGDRGKIIFSGESDDVELDNVSVNLSFDTSTSGSWLVIRRNKTSRALASYAETLRSKHSRKRWGKKA